MSKRGEEDFVDYITSELERHFDEAGVFVRETWRSQTWLPDYARPPPPPTPRYEPRFIAAEGILGSTRRWIADHMIFTAAAVTFLSTGGFLLYQRRKSYMRKRRAKKRSNGKRKEVVVVAGVPNSPVTRSVFLDLERRGFIVYVIASSPHEEQLVKDERKTDLMPLHLNVSDPSDVESTIRRFGEEMPPITTVSGSAEVDPITFAGLVLVPDLIYPAGPAETITTELWFDALNAKVLSTVATAQAFLRMVREHQSRIVILTPTIIHSMKPPFHGVESAVVGALEGFTSSLRGELATFGARVCQVKMGTFDCSNVGERQSLERDARAEVLSWPSYARTAYARNFSAQSGAMEKSNMLGPLQSRRKGSSLRTLNNSVFDALTLSRPWSVQRVGQGSLLYGMIGTLAPAQLVSWMMGVQPLVQDRTPERRDSDSQWEQLESTA
ncbi:MAG: hypothetical protein M1828_001933 [Chrysothrix sp. TS-e1954]|nr:MAG: hypothetical protein M1828_001933 [Chrysothrix sp. TS-e1954]